MKDNVNISLFSRIFHEKDLRRESFVNIAHFDLNINNCLTTANPSSIILTIKYFKQRRLSAEFTLPGKRFFVAKIEGSIKRYGQLQSERTL